MVRCQDRGWNSQRCGFCIGIDRVGDPEDTNRTGQQLRPDDGNRCGHTGWVYALEVEEKSNTESTEITEKKNSMHSVSSVFKQIPPELNRISGEIVDASYTVHKALGPGLLESAYEACMVYELEKRSDYRFGNIKNIKD